MSTPYSLPIDAFLTRVEEDENFFSYFRLTETEALEMATRRARTYLWEAIGLLTLKCTPDVDFYDCDNALGIFNVDWTGQEVFLISSLMYEMYLSRDIAKLKCLSVNYTATDLRVFDPSSARTTFKALYNIVVSQNLQLIDDYISKDRITGAPKGIKYALYNETE